MPRGPGRGRRLGALTRPAATIAALTLALSAQTAHAQGLLTVHSARAQVGIEYLGLWSDYESGPTVNQANFREWAEMGVRGAVLDPRFIDLRLRIRPEWRQSRWAGETEAPDQNSTRLNWHASMSLFRDRPVSLRVGTLRSTTRIRSQLGAETDVVTSELTGSIRARIPYLPVQATFRRYTQDYDLRSRLQPVRQWFSSSRLRLSARNRKTQFLLERQWYDDHLQQANDFTETHSVLHHVFRWGKGSRLESDADYIDRSGSYRYRNLSWWERVHLQHTTTVSSDYELRLGSVRSGLGTSNFRWLAGAVSFPATSSVRARLEISSHATQFEIGHESILRAGPRVDLAARLPLRARLGAGASLMYERATQQPMDDGWLVIVGERHIVEPRGSFFLDRASVDLSSVQVMRLDRTFVYQPELDYELVETGPFAEVVVLPTGRITVGDSLLVDYRHRLLPQASRDQLVGTLDLNVSAGPFLAYHHLRLTGQLGVYEEAPFAVPTGAAVASLRDLDEVAVGIRYRGRTPIGRADAGIERSTRTAETFRIETLEFRAALSFNVRSNVMGSLRAAAARTNGTDGPASTLSGNVSVVWWVIRSLTLQGALGSWRRNAQGLEAFFLGGGLVAEWRPGKLHAVLRYDRALWDEVSPRLDDRMSVMLVREF